MSPEMEIRMMFYRKLIKECLRKRENMKKQIKMLDLTLS